MNRHALILFRILIFFSLATGWVFCQEESTTEEEFGFPFEEWVLGDVISLDLENNQLTLGYIDYDTDNEEQITISVDTDTKYENVNSLEDIKVGDVVAIDYIITLQDETKALNISVEGLKGIEE